MPASRGVRAEQGVQCTVYSNDPAHLQTLNEVYGRFFKTNPPARNLIFVSGWHGPFDVEVSCVAAVQRRRCRPIPRFERMPDVSANARVATSTRARCSVSIRLRSHEISKSMEGLHYQGKLLKRVAVFRSAATAHRKRPSHLTHVQIVL